MLGRFAGRDVCWIVSDFVAGSPVAGRERSKLRSFVQLAGQAVGWGREIFAEGRLRLEARVFSASKRQSSRLEAL
jgi:hypothetical protein